MGADIYLYWQDVPTMNEQRVVFAKLSRHGKNLYFDLIRNLLEQSKAKEEARGGDGCDGDVAFVTWGVGSSGLFSSRLPLFLEGSSSEKELPECTKNEVCSKVDLYGTPWVERQCRCPEGHSCPKSLHATDGHTIVDKTRQYKLCEPVKRLPICRYFKDVTWTLAPGSGPRNTTIQKINCRCRPGSVPYLVKRQPHRTSDGSPNFIYSFACSPQSRIRCQEKEPCRLFTVRKRHSTQLEEVVASPLCQCSMGSRCPKKHTDLGSIPASSYSGYELKIFSGYCVPTHHNEPMYVV
ncbi:hypothetical protein KQX54_005455 [Cotesia glomerata]|uniref:Protein giant-lens n=1 Tax=Cotesia glomerata TaxID=32391 RepID=A0AAV7HXD3_COTGL|nr:hypothetical protein KQX54_005455 [Cotesia glomerata]